MEYGRFSEELPQKSDSTITNVSDYQFAQSLVVEAAPLT
jgi:hypothetical protein